MKISDQKYITQIFDVDGLPRAFGIAATETASQAEAERQWAARVAKRTAEGTLDRSEERGATTTRDLAKLAKAAERAARR